MTRTLARDGLAWDPRFFFGLSKLSWVWVRLFGFSPLQLPVDCHPSRFLGA